MGAVAAFVGLVALLAFVIGLVMLVVNAIRKRRLRIWAITAGTAFLVFVLMVVFSPESSDSLQGEASNDSSQESVAKQPETITPTPEDTPTPQPTDTRTPIPEFRAADLYVEYDKNPIAGDLKYKGQVIIVHGIIDNISGDFLRTVSLGSDGFLETYVSCKFPREYLPNLVDLAKGQQVALRGTVDSRGVFGTIMLKDCDVVGFTEAIPPTALPDLDNFPSLCAPPHPGSELAFWHLRLATPALEPGETRRWIISFADAGVWGVITPSPGTDVLANTACDGSGQDGTHALEADIGEQTNSTVEILITNHSSERQYLQLFQLRGPIRTP